MGILSRLFARRERAPVASPKPARGRDAIDAALERLYPDTLELRIAGTARAAGHAPSIVELAIYPSRQCRPHWHYVSYGLSEVDKKRTGDPYVSGFGIELTFRLLRGHESSAPRWPLAMLSALADHVMESGGRYAPGQVKRLPEAIPELGAMHSALFVGDPELTAIDTINGRLSFLQVALLTASEAAHIADGAGDKFAEELVRVAPLYIADVARPSLRG